MKYILILALTMAAQAKRTEAPLVPPPPERPIPLEANMFQAKLTPGSLWSEIPARQMMGVAGNARQGGDLITVRIADRTSSAVVASPATLRETTDARALSA